MLNENEDCDKTDSYNKVKSRKRKSFGRIRDVQKKIRLQSHEIGEPCTCPKKCFESLTDGNKKNIIRNMNSLKCNDEVNMHLSGLISLMPVQRRRPRKDEEEVNFRECSVSYCIKVNQDSGTVHTIQVCKNAFISLHGITRGKIDCLVSKLKKDISVPRDLRGTHENRPQKIKEGTIAAVHEHINSFQTRNSHYSLKKSDRVYLDETLNIKKMFDEYKLKYSNFPISYESYRSIFNKDFNISFGYPRCDTCSSCDKFAAESKALNLKLADNTDMGLEEKEKMNNELRALNIAHEVHLRKQETFYKRKTQAKKEARKSKTKEAITMDYSRNLPCPNIQTNDVYYKRQLSVYIFNIHVLSTGASYFYIYPETIGNKGADEVCSFLFDFVHNHLDTDVSELEIFCDSCSGQNKNNIVLKLCHHLVHNQKKLSSIKFTYPIRGHSYLECDKNTSLINKRAKCETPFEWCEAIESARAKPSPFVVIDFEKKPELIKSWTEHLDLLYQKSLLFPTRPIRELIIYRSSTVLIRLRTNYNGAWEKVPIKETTLSKKNVKILPFPLTEKQEKRRVLQEKRENLKQAMKNLRDGEIILPEPAYEGLLPLSKEKCIDLQSLKEFCGPQAKQYFDSLPVQ